jgi:hypothetical protein
LVACRSFLFELASGVLKRAVSRQAVRFDAVKRFDQVDLAAMQRRSDDATDTPPSLDVQGCGQRITQPQQVGDRPERHLADGAQVPCGSSQFERGPCRVEIRNECRHCFLRGHSLSFMGGLVERR